MKKFIIVYFNNSNYHISNTICENLSKSEAIEWFNSYYDDYCVIINIIEL